MGVSWHYCLLLGGGLDCHGGHDRMETPHAWPSPEHRPVGPLRSTTPAKHLAWTKMEKRSEKKTRTLAEVPETIGSKEHRGRCHCFRPPTANGSGSPRSLQLAALLLVSVVSSLRLQLNAAGRGRWHRRAGPGVVVSGHWNRPWLASWTLGSHSGSHAAQYYTITTISSLSLSLSWSPMRLDLLTFCFYTARP